MSNPDLPPDSTATVVAFDTTPLAEAPDAGRVTAPQAGRYGFEKAPAFTAEPGGTVELQMTQTAPRALFDPQWLRTQVGERITVSGPRSATGVLLSVDVTDDGLSVTLRIEKGRD